MFEANASFMLNKEIPEEDLQNIKMVILDSDGVCIPRGTTIKEYEDADDTIYVCEFSTNVITYRLAEKINRLKDKVEVIISSGRSLIYLQSMYSKILGGNVELMAENGCIMLNTIGHVKQLVILPEAYLETIRKIRSGIKQLPIGGFEPKQFILTVHCDTELGEVYDVVEEHDTNNKLKVMWNGEAFDIQPKSVSKGTAIQEMLLRTRMPDSGIGSYHPSHHLYKENVLAIGDRINDKEMLDEAGIAVSADIDALEAPYYTIGEGLPGEILVDYLLDRMCGHENN